jgi:hypothetical protein
MSALRNNGRRVKGKRRILENDPQDGGGVDREAILHRKRKDCMVSLLSEFEQVIEALVEPGHEREIEHFKRSCRDKLNSLTWLATELMKLKPGEQMNEAMADLIQRLTSGANGGHSRP